MDRRDFVKALAGLVLCPLCGSTGFAAEDVHWSYEGTTGPGKWGELDAADRVCGTGSQQSPITIDDSIKARLPPLRFAWAKKADTIVNNGHTIQLNFSDGGELKIGPASYKLVQYHFHHPSEHLINGKPFAMEVHFVHQNDSGLAVIGVFLKAGKPNPAFARIVRAMPQSEGEPVTADPKINPMALLPAKREYYRYAGSLTTPPCSQTVDWLVLKTPIEVAAADVEAFAKLYPLNARPVQMIDRRFILRSGA